MRLFVFMTLLLLGLQGLSYRAAAADGGKTPPGAKAEPAEETDPLGANAACYVCHITFVKEELSKVHLAAKVGCVKCHGLSAKHANDENIGATKPDITFKHDRVDAACKKCHEDHNVPAGKVVGRFVARRLSGSCTPVCTDCHGMHKIEKEKP